jgi:hypothetical protein
LALALVPASESIGTSRLFLSGSFRQNFIQSFQDSDPLTVIEKVKRCLKLLPSQLILQQGGNQRFWACDVHLEFLCHPIGITRLGS